MSRDKYLLEPHQDDGVAIKLGGGSDFKMGVIVSTDQCPRIKVRTLLYGKTDTLLMQSRNLGLLYSDPPPQRCAEVLAENDAREVATAEINEFWHNKPVNLVQTEKRKLSADHRDQVAAGGHPGRVNLITGFS